MAAGRPATAAGGGAGAPLPGYAAREVGAADAGGAAAGGVAQSGGWLAWLKITLGTIAGAALFAMMTLTFVDVMGRKFLAGSIIGGVELTELLMLALIYAAMPLASLSGAHVMFDVFDAILPDRVKHWQSIVGNLVCAVLQAAAAWFVLDRAMRTRMMGDITAQLAIPLAPFHFAAAALLAGCAVMHLYLAFSGRHKA